MSKLQSVAAVCATGAVIVCLAGCSSTEPGAASPSVVEANSGSEPAGGTGEVAMTIDGKPQPVEGTVECQEIEALDYYGLFVTAADGRITVRLSNATPLEVRSVSIGLNELDEDGTRVAFSIEPGGYPTGDKTHADVTVDGSTYTVSGVGIDTLSAGEPHDFTLEITCP